MNKPVGARCSTDVGLARHAVSDCAMWKSAGAVMRERVILRRRSKISVKFASLSVRTKNRM